MITRKLTCAPGQVEATKIGAGPADPPRDLWELWDLSQAGRLDRPGLDCPVQSQLASSPSAALARHLEYACGRGVETALGLGQSGTRVTWRISTIASCTCTCTLRLHRTSLLDRPLLASLRPLTVFALQTIPILTKSPFFPCVVCRPAFSRSPSKRLRWSSTLYCTPLSWYQADRPPPR